MRRAVLTIGGTAAGLAALFSFRTHSAIGVADATPAPDSASASASGSASPTGPVYPTASSLKSPTTKPSGAKSTATAAPTMGSSTAPASVAPSTTKASTTPTKTSPTTKAPTTSPTTKAPTAPATTPAASPKTYTGTNENTQYGPMQVQITVTGSKITGVNELQQPDDSIGSNAVSQLDSETLSAQSASIQAVSGATYTSNGYIASLQSAVDQAGL